VQQNINLVCNICKYKFDKNCAPSSAHADDTSAREKNQNVSKIIADLVEEVENVLFQRRQLINWRLFMMVKEC
jgi:hypothetical protein